MTPGGELGGWDVAETRVQALAVIALANKAVEIFLSVFQVEIILQIDLLRF